jgi:hypothetical protein
MVGHNRSLNTIVVALHGSINTADWVSNFNSYAVNLQTLDFPSQVPIDRASLPKLQLLGRAHAGFLHKYLSCRAQIMAEVDRALADLTDEEKHGVKFYVTGHSQAAALAQILFGDLCQHLRSHYGPEFSNAQENRVHLWALSSPVALDATAKAFIEGIGGRLNMVVQNTWLDPVPNVGLTFKGRQFKAVGTPVMQSTAEALRRAAIAHAQATRTHLETGDYREAATGALAPLTGGAAKFMIGAAHMATDNVNYRGVGSSYAFDPDMVVKDVDGITEGLQMAFDHHQEKLRTQAKVKAKAANTPPGAGTSGPSSSSLNSPFPWKA